MASPHLRRQPARLLRFARQILREGHEAVDIDAAPELLSTSTVIGLYTRFFFLAR